MTDRQFEGDFLPLRLLPDLTSAHQWLPPYTPPPPPSLPTPHPTLCLISRPTTRKVFLPHQYNHLITLISRTSTFTNDLLVQAPESSCPNSHISSITHSVPHCLPLTQLHALSPHLQPTLFVKEVYSGISFLDPNYFMLSEYSYQLLKTYKTSCIKQSALYFRHR